MTNSLLLKIVIYFVDVPIENCDSSQLCLFRVIIHSIIIQ